MTTEELFKQAQEMLGPDGDLTGWTRARSDAIRAALARPQDVEPVAWRVEGWHEGKRVAYITRDTLEDAKASAAVFAQHYTTVHTIPLYAHPPAPQAPTDLIPQDALFVCGQMGAHVTRVRVEQAAPQAPVRLTDEQVAAVYDVAAGHNECTFGWQGDNVDAFYAARDRHRQQGIAKVRSAIESAVLAAPAVPAGYVAVPVSLLERARSLLGCIGCSPEGVDEDVRQAEALQNEIAAFIYSAPKGTP